MLETTREAIIQILNPFPKERWEDDGWLNVMRWNANQAPPVKKEVLKSIFDEVVGEMDLSEDDFEPEIVPNPDGKKQHKKPEREFISSKILADGRLVEMIYNEQSRETKLAVFDGDSVNYVDEIGIYKPYSPANHLINKKVIRFSSEAKEYNSEKELIEEIQKFIHKYLDISSFFEKIAAYYVLFSWIYDRFNELPYLRALGDYGSGKSRLLQVVGLICYKPMFVGGATTTSPIFRIINDFQGTLIMDEADYRFSDTTVDIIKILNSGFQKGMPVLRSEPEGRSKFGIKSYDVFCPKIIATRKHFKDQALESRFIIEEMDKKELREDIPINLPEDFEKETTSLRNKLLMWRFRNFKNSGLRRETIDKTLEPRLNQIIMPLLSIIKDDELKNELKGFVKEYNKQLVVDRGMSLESEILEAILTILNASYSEPTIKHIAETYNANQTNEKDKLNPKRVGSIIRKNLKLKPRRTDEGFVVSEIENKEKLSFLKKKFGIEDKTKMNEMNVMNVVEDKGIASNQGEIDVSKLDF